MITPTDQSSPMNDNRIFCIIVAAGTGSRFGADLPKQFCDLNGLPVVMHTINRLRASLPSGSELLLVISDQMRSLWDELCRRHAFESPRLVSGGATRWQSVANALSVLPDDDATADRVVMVHDAARPFVTKEVVDRLAEAVTVGGGDGAVPAVAVTDSMRILGNDSTSSAVDRSRYRAVQTPQAFKLSTLKKAYLTSYSPAMTDDASVCEAAGMTAITMVEGDHRTLKITHPADMATVTYYMSEDGSTSKH